MFDSKAAEKTLVINLFAGPGAGKSTMAAGLFALMKLKGRSCELVTEYAKDIVWSGADVLLKNQLMVFAVQHDRISRLLGKVDFIITDSPLELSKVYARLNCDGQDITDFNNLVDSECAKIDVLNVLVERVKPYAGQGRIQNEREAKRLDSIIRSLVNFDLVVQGDPEGPETIYNTIYNTIY